MELHFSQALWICEHVIISYNYKSFGVFCLGCRPTLTSLTSGGVISYFLMIIIIYLFEKKW